jgi:hypothetical protein
LRRTCLLLTQSGHWSEGELASQICEVFNFEQTLFLSESILPWLFGEEFTHAMPRPHNFERTRLPIGLPRCPAGPEAIEIIYEAYVKARRPVCDIGKPDPVNEIIALRILSLAKQGERDPDRLRAGALATVSIQTCS